MLIIAFIIGSYLLGSIPFAYLAGKWSNGKDITRAGTGTTGAANVWQTVSRGAAIIIFLADMVKGAVPPLVSGLLGLGLPVQVISGLAAVVGHNWSVFLGFRGGRGIATIVGMFLVLSPGAAVISVIIGFLGAPLRRMALTVLVALALLPTLSWYFGRPFPVVVAGVAALLLAIIKRVEANRRPLKPGGNPWLVFLYRFLYDRDIRDRQAWLASRGEPDSQPLTRTSHKS